MEKFPVIIQITVYSQTIKNVVKCMNAFYRKRIAHSDTQRMLPNLTNFHCYSLLTPTMVIFLHEVKWNQ